MQQTKTSEGYVVAGDFAEWASGVPVNPKNQNVIDDHIRMHPPDAPCTRQYFGVGSMGELMDMAEQGWPAGVETLEALEESIRGKVADKLFKIRKRRRLVRRGAGNEYDVHAAYQGRHDKAWTVSESAMHTEGSVKKNKTVDICMTLGALSDVDAESMFYPVACALVAARILIGAGYQVRLFGVWRSAKVFVSHKAPYYAIRFLMLSDYGEFLNVHGASLLSHGGFCRWFVMLLGGCSAQYKCDEGMGYSQPVTEGVMESGLNLLGLRLGDHVMASPHPGSVSYMDAERAADYVVRDMLGSLV